MEVSLRTSVRDESIRPQAAKRSLKNNVSRLNSSAVIADEINNFRAPAIFSPKSSWPDELLILHLLRFEGCLAQLGNPRKDKNLRGMSRREWRSASRGEPVKWSGFARFGEDA
jgi:hypothetical protein